MPRTRTRCRPGACSGLPGPQARAAEGHLTARTLGGQGAPPGTAHGPCCPGEGRAVSCHRGKEPGDSQWPRVCGTFAWRDGLTPAGASRRQAGDEAKEDEASLPAPGPRPPRLCPGPGACRRSRTRPQSLTALPAGPSGIRFGTHRGPSARLLRQTDSPGVPVTPRQGAGGRAGQLERRQGGLLPVGGWKDPQPSAVGPDAPPECSLLSQTLTCLSAWISNSTFRAGRRQGCRCEGTKDKMIPSFSWVCPGGKVGRDGEQKGAPRLTSRP